MSQIRIRYAIPFDFARNVCKHQMKSKENNSCNIFAAFPKITLCKISHPNHFLSLTVRLVFLEKQVTSHKEAPKQGYGNFCIKTFLSQLLWLSLYLYGFSLPASDTICVRCSRYKVQITKWKISAGVVAPIQ